MGLMWLSAWATAAPAVPKVVMVAIDGVRKLEIEGKAVDDQGRPVSAESLFPELMALRQQGLFLPNLEISNPVGISLPAYADIFAGRRQERVVDNEPREPHSQYPTLFQALRRALGSRDAVALVSSWEPLCRLATTAGSDRGNDFYRSCGWKKGRDVKPEVFAGSRTDADTFLVLRETLQLKKPRFTFVHFGDADEEAHLHQALRDNKRGHYGIFHYHKALRETDYYIGQLVKQLRDDPFYRDQTYVVITTDHGRDDVPDPKQWWDHGECRKHRSGELCAGCRSVFALVLGPGIKPGRVEQRHTHADLAPTVAGLFGVEFPSAKGSAIPAVVEAAAKPPGSR